MRWARYSWARMFGANLPPEHRIKAPEPTESTLIDRLLSKDDLIVYFTYGADMSRTRFMRRRVGKRTTLLASGKTTATRPRKATLEEYRLVFGVPQCAHGPGEGRATVVGAPGSQVEGVAYRIPRGAMRFLDRLRHRLRTGAGAGATGTGSVDATMYVARADVVRGLYPMRQYRNTPGGGRRGAPTEPRLHRGFAHDDGSSKTCSSTAGQRGGQHRAAVGSRNVPHEPV